MRSSGYRVRDALHKHGGKYKGEIFYLGMISRFLCSFFSTKESIRWRVKSLSYVMNVVRMFRGFVYCAKRTTRESREGGAGGEERLLRV